MNSKIATAFVVVIFALSYAHAYAGDYHTGATLKCYECHQTHGGRTRAYADDPRDTPSAASVKPNGKHLLGNEDVNEICLNCHDGGTIIDVYGSAARGVQPEHRSAGCFNSDTTGSYAPFTSECGHDLGSQTDAQPGSAGSGQLTCVSCHDPHGNDYYRNLKDFGGGITYARGSNDTRMDVFTLKSYPSSSASEAYEAANISYNLTDGGASRLESFCTSCHPNQHTDARVGNGWMRHPTAGYSLPYTSGTVSPLKTLGGTPIAGETGPLTAGQVTCVTCHKAHGSTRPFGLIYDNRTTAEVEDGEGINVSATCQHCHDKGLTPAA